GRRSSRATSLRRCSTARVAEDPLPDPPHEGEGDRRESTVWLTDPTYPWLLKQIHDPPPRLFVRGRLPPVPMIAIVGSRRATPYGCRAAHRLARDLSDAGVVVVSGLARGIDAAPHRGPLGGGAPPVVEAAERGGALITARMGAEQGREVFCVPGSIENPLAIGGHRLIKDGAKLVQTVEDVLDEFADLAHARARAHARTPARTRTRTH